ncbi:opsin-5-like [Haliotis rubra]|uniref:opsin-5-like n=1 Tax=Haliotis rubra TaxID=36100 RepID=UPI001EE59825|nr:opsin-5-like [Haliotis rubra]
MEEPICGTPPLENNSLPVNWTRHKYCSGLEPWEDQIVGTYLILADLIAIPLNTLVICLAYRLRRSFTACDYYIVNLAISDLGHPLMGYPMTIAATFSHRWTFGKIGCDINGFLGFYFGVNSMTTLGVMSLVRYVSVKRPALVQVHNRWKVITSLLAIHSYAFFWAITPLAGWGMYDVERYGLSCTLLWSHPNKSYLLSSFVFCLALPISAMAFSYISITSISTATRQKMLRWKQNTRWKQWSLQELRLLKVTILMLSVFVLAWTPYAIVSMIEAFASNVTIPMYVSLVPALCAKASHILDPLIYFGMNKKFKRLMPSLFNLSTLQDGERTPSSVGQSATPRKMLFSM